MITESQELRAIALSLYEDMNSISDNLASVQLSEDKWSIKEIFGHLVDSAGNNYQRFIRLQRSERLDFPGYDPEWIKTVPYNDYSFPDLVDLWKQFNLLLCHVIEHIDPDCRANVWIYEGKELTLDFLVKDYIRHLEDHIDHLGARLGELKAAGY